jgi:MFS family permease
MATPDLNTLSYLQTLKRKKFWFMFTMWLLWATNANLITTHIIPYATDAGISNIEASTIVSIMGGVQILSRLLFGRISDVIGRRIPAVICALLGSGAILWLLWSHDLPMFYLFAIVFGLGWGGLGVNLVTLSSEIFASPNLGAIFGTLEMGYALGAAVGPLIGGAIFDMTGNYAIAFIVGANTMLIIAFLVIVTRR